MYKYKILTISQVIDSEKEFIIKNSRKKIFNIASNQILNFINKKFKNQKILFICGNGNNGKDGTETSKLIKKQQVLYYKVNFTNDSHFEKLKKLIVKCDIIFDCIFGVGLNRKLDLKFKNLISLINSSKKRVISIDLPSGFDGDSGNSRGGFINADETLVMGFYKPAHFLLPAKQYMGDIHLLSLGLKPPKMLIPNIELINKEMINIQSKFFKIDINKYHKGHVLVVGGKMPGASYIVSKSARKIGAGLSTIVTDEVNLKFYNIKDYGTILDTYKKKSLDDKNVLVIGPGLGKKYSANKIEYILKNFKKPIIIDADAISIFKDNKKKLHTLLSKKDNVILTPHLGEFKRIFEYKLNKSKIFNCLVASKLINNPVVLKGNDTVVAFPDERVYVDYGASNSLATAGTGDMLCGLISGLIAQGYKIKESILSAILIQRIISQSKNKTIVEDFIDLIPQTLNLLKKNN